MRERIESLFRACEEGDLERARGIVAEGYHDVDGGNSWQTDCDPQGWHRSPLFIAIVHGQLEVARWLLEQGADPNRSSKYGDTPLTMILQPPLSDHWLDAVELLMAHGADPAIANDEGASALDLARKAPRVWEKVKPLLGAE